MVSLLLLGIALLAGGLFWFSRQQKPASSPVFVNQSSIGVWGPIQLSLPVSDGQIQKYSYQINPDVPFDLWQQNEQVELQFTSPGATDAVYTLRLIPAEQENSAQTVEWSFILRKPEVVYMDQQQDGADLWVVTPETGQKRQLTITNGSIQDYAISRDGENIFFHCQGNPIRYRYLGC